MQLLHSHHARSHLQDASLLRMQQKRCVNQSQSLESVRFFISFSCSSRQVSGLRPGRVATRSRIRVEVPGLPPVQRVQARPRPGIQSASRFPSSELTDSRSIGHGAAVLRVRHDVPPRVPQPAAGERAGHVHVGVRRLPGERLGRQDARQGAGSGGGDQERKGVAVPVAGQHGPVGAGHEATRAQGAAVRVGDRRRPGPEDPRRVRLDARRRVQVLQSARLRGAGDRPAPERESRSALFRVSHSITLPDCSRRSTGRPCCS